MREGERGSMYPWAGRERLIWMGHGEGNYRGGGLLLMFFCIEWSAGWIFECGDHHLAKKEREKKKKKKKKNR